MALLLGGCAIALPGADTWSPEEFTVVSGPASPRVALAVRRDGARLAVAVDAAVLPGGEPSVKIGVGAAKQVVLDAAPDKAAGSVRRFTATIPAASLIGSDADWKRLRIGVATVWSGGPGDQPRLSERFRHTGGAAHRGLASDAALWQPFDLDENATAVADRKNRIVIPIEQPVDGKATVVIEMPDGKRLRNLVGGLEMAKGRQQIAWDGCDDDGQPLPPGTYRWRAAHHPGLTPRYLMSFGNGDNSPADFGGWGPNHTIITAAAANGPWTVMCSPMTEGGDNIVVLKADGTKDQGHTSPMGTGMWTICPAIIGDVLYCTNDGMAWGDHFDEKKKDAVGRLKIGLTRYDLKNQRLVEYQGKRFTELYSVEVGPGAADKDWQQVSLVGMAAFGGKLYVANRRTSSLMIINPENGAQLAGR